MQGEASEKELADEFLMRVHDGFRLAQELCIKDLTSILSEKKTIKKRLKIARQENNREIRKQLEAEENYLLYQELCFRKAMDSIAWVLFNYQSSSLKRLYQNQEVIDITDSNIESEIAYAKFEYEKDKTSFTLISDLTSFVQVGDIVERCNGKVSVIELKTGSVNEEIFDLMHKLSEGYSPKEICSTVISRGEKFTEQFQRDVKQMEKSQQVVKIINTGEGKDSITDANVEIIGKDDEPLVLDSYADELAKVIKESDKSGLASTIFQSCISIVAIRKDKFRNREIPRPQKKGSSNSMLVDLRQGFRRPLGYPIYLLDIPDPYISDIILGKREVYINFDIDSWIHLCARRGIKVDFLNKKEIARTNGKMKNRNRIFEINGQGLKLSNENGGETIIGGGLFDRVFTEMNTPFSLIDMYTYELGATLKS